MIQNPDQDISLYMLIGLYSDEYLIKMRKMHKYLNRLVSDQ